MLFQKQIPATNRLLMRPLSLRFAQGLGTSGYYKGIVHNKIWRLVYV